MTAPEISEILARGEEARMAGLSGAELLGDPAAVREQCNGIGAAAFPARLRETLDRLHPALVTPAWIHDRRYSIGGGEADRKAADREFLANGRRMIRRDYSAWSWKRYWEELTVLRFYGLLLEGGRIAYRYDQL